MCQQLCNLYCPGGLFAVLDSKLCAVPGIMTPFTQTKKLEGTQWDAQVAHPWPLSILNHVSIDCFPICPFMLSSFSRMLLTSPRALTLTTSLPPPHHRRHLQFIQELPFATTRVFSCHFAPTVFFLSVRHLCGLLILSPALRCPRPPQGSTMCSLHVLHPARPPQHPQNTSTATTPTLRSHLL